jgi:hypothetical protein
MPHITPKSVITFIVLLGIAGCQSPTPVKSSPSGPAPVAQGNGESVFQRCYQLDPAASELRVLVYKAGPLADFGHNHVMVSHKLTGALALAQPTAGSRLSVVLPVASLEVDPPAPRAEEGADFSSDVSDEARSGTRANMLGEAVLNAETFPDVSVEMISLTGPLWSADATLRIRLKDQIREQTISVNLQEQAPDFTASSSFTISQSDFGMTPFSVLGGGLMVADPVKIRAHLKFVASEAGSFESCLPPADPTQVDPKEDKP